MKKRGMVIVSLFVYLFFVIALVASIICFEDGSEARYFAFIIISSGLSMSTLILAILFTRKTPSEMYLEKYGDGQNKG